MVERINISVPDYQAKFIDDRNISPSSVLQDALDERIEQSDWEP